MANCAIVGINWGDEGKGRMVDYLTGQYDVVVRYQGGGNAGHTVINDMGKFALHLLPSGIFRAGVMNILGNGVARASASRRKTCWSATVRRCCCRGIGSWTRWRRRG